MNDTAVGRLGVNASRRTKAGAPNQLDEAGKRIFAAYSDYAMGARLISSHALDALQMRFPATEYVASLAMVQVTSLRSP